MEELLRYESVSGWMSNFPDRPNTIRNYLLRLGQFTRWAGKDPDTLVAEAKEDPSAAHNRMKKYYNLLLKEGKSSKTAVFAYQCLRSFYRWNDVTLGRTPRGFKGRVEFESSRVLSQDEIARMRDACTCARDRAIITFLAQSGQRSGILTALRYRHVRRGLEADERPVIIEVHAALRNGRGVNVNKLGEAYRFAVGEDSTHDLRTMLEERERDGEPIDDDSWLFRSYSEASGEAGRKNPRRTAKGTPGNALTTTSIGDIVHEAASRAGIQRKASGKRYEVHPHIFRRYWNMRMQEAGLSEDLRDFMLGHKLPYDGAYSRWYPDAVKREWAAKNVERFI